MKTCEWFRFWYKDGSVIEKEFNNDIEVFAYIEKHKDEVVTWGIINDEPFGP